MNLPAVCDRREVQGQSSYPRCRHGAVLLHKTACMMLRGSAPGVAPLWLDLVTAHVASPAHTCLFAAAWWNAVRSLKKCQCSHLRPRQLGQKGSHSPYVCSHVFDLILHWQLGRTRGQRALRSGDLSIGARNNHFEALFPSLHPDNILSNCEQKW